MLWLNVRLALGAARWLSCGSIVVFADYVKCLSVCRAVCRSIFHQFEIVSGRKIKVSISVDDFEP